MRILRISLSIVLITTIIFLGFLREKYLLVLSSKTLFSIVNKYPRIAATDFKNELGNLFTLNLSPKLLSSILYSIAFAVLTSLLVMILTRSRNWGKIILLLYAGYAVVCFIFIVLGNLGVDYRLSYGLSHYIEDLFLSPFILMMIFPIILFKPKEKQ